MNGPGKYDELCTFVRERSHGQAAIVIVLGGNKGSGFSVQMTELITPAELARMLRVVATDLEREPTP